MFMWTVAELSRLFTSSRSDGAIDAPTFGCEEVADLLSRGALSIRRQTYTQTSEPRQTIPLTRERQAFEQACSISGNRAHSLLRWWAWNWLRRMGEHHPIYDFQIGDTALDVVAPSIGITAECGDADPLAVIQTLNEPDWQTLAIFPYPRQVTLLTFSVSRPSQTIPEFEVYLLSAVKS